jgi:hypothetical protein
MILTLLTALTLLGTAQPAQFGMQDLMQILGWVTAFVSMLGTVILVPILKNKWQAQAKAEVVVGPQPFIVDFKKEFITRAEHDVYRMEVRADFQRVEANFQRMSDKVETKHLELLATIERAAKTGVDGRVHLWEALKPLGNEVAALKATSNVAQQLEKLGATLEKITTQNNGKTTR